MSIVDDKIAQVNEGVTKAKAWYASHQFYAGVIAGLLFVGLLKLLKAF